MDLFSMSPSESESPQFNLDRDIVFFDIESTGLNILKDRIIQIALIKYSKDNISSQELELMINPEMPIPAESRAVHGITDDMVSSYITHYERARFSDETFSVDEYSQFMGLVLEVIERIMQ